MGTFIGIIGNDNDRKCTVYTYNGWYVQHGGTMVHKAVNPENLITGSELESIEDEDFWSWPDEINSEKELINAVDS